MALVKCSHCGVPLSIREKESGQCRGCGTKIPRASLVGTPKKGWGFGLTFMWTAAFAVAFFLSSLPSVVSMPVAGLGSILGIILLFVVTVGIWNEVLEETHRGAVGVGAAIGITAGVVLPGLYCLMRIFENPSPIDGNVPVFFRYALILMVMGVLSGAIWGAAVGAIWKVIRFPFKK